MRSPCDPASLTEVAAAPCIEPQPASAPLSISMLRLECNWTAGAYRHAGEALHSPKTEVNCTRVEQCDAIENGCSTRATATEKSGHATRALRFHPHRHRFRNGLKHTLPSPSGSATATMPSHSSLVIFNSATTVPVRTGGTAAAMHVWCANGGGTSDCVVRGRSDCVARGCEDSRMPMPKPLASTCRNTSNGTFSDPAGRQIRALE